MYEISRDRLFQDLNHKNLRNTMERYFEDYNREYMKRAILKQEESFREQVNELHRLYHVQKKMMRDLKSSSIQRWATADKNNNSSCQFSPNRTLDLRNNTEEYNYGRNEMVETDMESDLELTLATGGNRRRSRKKKQENSDSGASHSSSSTESVGETLKLNEWGLFQMTEKTNSCNDEKRGDFHIDQSMRQQEILKHPSWHLQCLSLKMT